MPTGNRSPDISASRQVEPVESGKEELHVQTLPTGIRDAGRRIDILRFLTCVGDRAHFNEHRGARSTCVRGRFGAGTRSCSGNPPLLSAELTDGAVFCPVWRMVPQHAPQQLGDDIRSPS